MSRIIAEMELRGFSDRQVVEWERSQGKLMELKLAKII